MKEAEQMKVLTVVTKGRNDFYGDHWRAAGVECSQITLPSCGGPRFKNKRQVAIDEIKMLVRLLTKLPKMKGKTVYSHSSQYALMLIWRLFGWYLGKSRLVLNNFYIHQMGHKGWVKRVLRFLITNSRLTLILQTPGEVGFYSALSAKPRLEFVPYCSDCKPIIAGGGAE